MKTKSIFQLAFATAFFAAFATVMVNRDSASKSEAEASGKLFPALLDSINAVSKLTLENADGKVTLMRVDGNWGLVEKHNYPVDLENVTKCLRGLALMETIEKKTKQPQYYSKLGVAGLGEGSSSTLITLGDENQKVVANLIVGSKRTGRTIGDEYYVRKHDDEQTWLVSAPLRTDTDSSIWIDKQIVKIERARVQAVSVEHASGEILNISKPNAETLIFTVHDLPEDRELSYSGISDGVATTLEWLNLEDVVPTSEIELSDDWANKSTFWTFSGIQIEVTVTEKDGEHWAQFRASFDQDGPSFEEPLQLESSEATSAELAILQARFSRWIYKLPVHSVTALGKRMSQLLKPLPLEPAEPDGGEMAEGEMEPATDGMNIQDLLTPEQLQKLNAEHNLDLPVDDG